MLSALGIGYVLFDDANNSKKNQSIIDIPNKEEYEIKEDEEIEPIEDSLEEIDNNSEISKDTDKNSVVKEESENTKTENKQDNTINIESDVKEETSKNEPSIPSKTLLNSTNTTEDEVTYKYGVKITTTTTYKVDTYSDGSVNKTKISSKTSYDKSTFSATTNELKTEATSIVNKNKKVYQEILGYVNGYRSEVSVNSLVLDDTLSVAATIRALEMAYSSEILEISHTRPNGTSCGTIFNEMGINVMAWGENIAAGYKTAASVSDGWRNSKGHYENMITNYFGKIGVGMVELNGDKYWVQLFSN